MQSVHLLVIACIGVEELTALMRAVAAATLVTDRATTSEAAATLLRRQWCENDCYRIYAYSTHISVYVRVRVCDLRIIVCMVYCMFVTFACFTGWLTFSLSFPLSTGRHMTPCPARCMSVHITERSCILNPYIQPSIHMPVHISVSLIVCLPILSRAPHAPHTPYDTRTSANVCVCACGFFLPRSAACIFHSIRTPSLLLRRFLILSRWSTFRTSLHLPPLHYFFTH